MQIGFVANAFICGRILSLCLFYCSAQLIFIKFWVAHTKQNKKNETKGNENMCSLFFSALQCEDFLHTFLKQRFLHLEYPSIIMSYLERISFDWYVL